MRWLIYGANGYSGQLIAKEAVRRKMEPILAGRNREALEALSAQLIRESRVFPLDPKILREQLEDIDLLVNCAGPFSKTAEPLANACLESGCHYIDITGEIGVFEALKKKDEAAKAAKVSLIPGVGFDVIPTDCLALELKALLPNAQSLELAFRGNKKVSPGTLKTMLENIPIGTVVRRQGKILSAPWGSFCETIPFSSKDRTCLSIPWGDISTAFTTTNIPNITVYSMAPPWLIRVAPLIQKFNSVLGSSPFQQLAKKLVDKFIQGPTDKERLATRMEVWGRVRDENKEICRSIEIAEGYHFTQESTLKVVERFEHKPPPPGYLTPALAFGADFVFEVANSRRLQ